MRRPVTFQSGQFGATLNDSCHLITGKPSTADPTAFVQSSEQWARRGGCNFEPGNQCLGSRSTQRHFPAHATVVRLGRTQGVNPSLGIQLPHIID